MIRVDAYYIYQVGAAIRPLLELTLKTSLAELRPKLWTAGHYLDGLLNKSIFHLKTCRNSGIALLETVTRLQGEVSASGVDLTADIDPFDHYLLTTQSQAFETVLGAEFQLGNLYLVAPKGGYDLNELTEHGIVIFPPDLPRKAPDAILDAQQAARCIAFELPTAAAFHMHRINETVLRKYYDFVTGGKPRPENRNIGAYIDAMKNHQVGDKKIFSALANVKNFHRNPVLHPDDDLKSIDEAISLLGTINTVIGAMLDVLPPPELTLTPPPANEEEASQKS